MFQRILVPLDGLPGAERAIPIAARIARRAGGTLVFVHVVPPLTMLGNPSDKTGAPAAEIEREERVLGDAANYLAEVIAAHAWELAGISTEMDVAFGLTSPMLASTARLEQVDLIVMCSHHEAGLGLWGIESIALQTMRRSPVPLLVLNERGDIPQLDAGGPLRVLVPLDGSLFAEAALEPAFHLLFQLAHSASDELCLMRVVEDRDTENVGASRQAEHYLRMMKERLEGRSSSARHFSITTQVRAGKDVARMLLEETRGKLPLHVIVMATHSREGMQRLLLGSVAERVLDAATCPLLVVCPSASTTSMTKPGRFAAGKM
jgi:nucleotide-binding universal stress UspA family protein